jgi:hypothetical protein
LKAKAFSPLFGYSREVGHSPGTGYEYGYWKFNPCLGQPGTRLVSFLKPPWQYLVISAGNKRRWAVNQDGGNIGKGKNPIRDQPLAQRNFLWFCFWVLQETVGVEG